MPAQQNRFRLILLLVILVTGIFLRLPPEAFDPRGGLHLLAPLHPNPAYRSVGFDEDLYRTYVDGLTRGGLGAYPQIVDEYIEHQKTLTGSILPPVRFLYIFVSYLWRGVFGCDSITALHQVASCFNIFSLCLAGIFAWRLRGAVWSLGVLALFAFAPTQIHMSQHGLVDGFFTFWATLTLWLLWENLAKPRDWRWLVAYVVVFVLLVITKENSAFVWFACAFLILSNHWLRFGTVTRELLIATVLGPLLGVVVLIFLAGGIPTLFETYHLSITKNFTLPFAIHTGDGPWHRYLIDLLLVSPIVLVLALGGIFRLTREDKPEWFLAIFVAASYLVMCNLKYGMNLRYANMWDMPLRFLAVSSLVSLVRPFGKYQNIVLGLAIAAICAVELREYIVLAVRFPLYELVPEALLRALHILK